MSYGALGIFTLKETEVTFARAGSDKVNFWRGFEGMVTIPDHLGLPNPRHRLPGESGPLGVAMVLEEFLSK